MADAESLRNAVGEHLPDVAVIDVRMPPTLADEGLRAAQSIHRDHPGVGVLVFSPYIETQSAAELFATAPGGVGYLLKDRVAGVSDFIDATTRVAHGGTVLDPEVVRQLLSASRRQDSLAALTPREREVLSHLAQGRSNVAIAGTLFISPKVVEKHVANIFDKLGLAPPTTTIAGSSPPSGTWSDVGLGKRIEIGLVDPARGPLRELGEVSAI